MISSRCSTQVDASSKGTPWLYLPCCLGLTEYVTVMAGLAVDGIPFGGVIHKPFSNQTIWSFGERKNELMGMLMITDYIRYRGRYLKNFLAE